ncbi:MAG: hypothetical protein ABL882_07055 [Sphingopyxis sp.]
MLSRPSHIAQIVLAALLVGVILNHSTPLPAKERDAISDFPCYDILVEAHIIAQVPSPLPDIDDGSIIMSWPWFIDLNIDRVLEGSVQRGRISVLTLQHAYFRPDLGSRRWEMQRNDMNGFNARMADPVQDMPRCEEGIIPAPAYIRNEEGLGLEEIRREGERQYGNHRR